MVDVVSSPEMLTAEWMTDALRESGHLSDGRVSALSYKTIGTGKMGQNARFHLEYAGDPGKAPVSVVGKFPAEDETARQMAGARGAYYNEVMFYRHLADRTTMRTPVIYANEITDDRQLFVTLMEDMAPAEPGSQLVGELLEHARMAMRQAARLAASFYGDESIADYDFVLSAARDDGGAMGQSLLQQFWPVFLERFGHGIDEDCRAFGDGYVDRHSTFVTRFEGPGTLAHGDFRSENILFSDSGACTVDWQTVCVASPLTDLAYFLGGSVEVGDRRNWERDLVREYSDVLASLGVKLGFDECWEQYREQAMHGLMITILGACFSEPGERSDAMFLTMIQRHLRHCIDLDAGDFLG